MYVNRISDVFLQTTGSSQQIHAECTHSARYVRTETKDSSEPKDVLQASCQKNRENFKVMKFLHTMLIQFHTYSRLLYEICGRFRGVIFPFSNSLGLFWWKYLIFFNSIETLESCVCPTVEVHGCKNHDSVHKDNISLGEKMTCFIHTYRQSKT